ncbi:ligase-associated DNA damage response exonuclease (plasmid) [Paroceanicella profunda]|uniref:Ligase-associated DNA damage response exonuclease n=1 Tax=Paroceanicella profunda TaxID=2579971 RepID=A0A5B8G426_9RHOB|nr:ligase-associated DNA damage response exonuclease [Paroceanicella profunda]
MSLLLPTPEGLYCQEGGFHIDPVRPVARALITHAHADHARAGHGAVLATRQTLDIMAIRYGAGFAGRQQAAAGPVEIGGVRVSFHPAGHVLGSAQIRLERGGTRVVVSGDYTRAPNPACAPFELVPCDIFVTEATFGLPVFRHPDPGAETRRLLASLAQFPERTHLVGAYALGKAQRMIMLLRAEGYDRPIHLHGALERLCAYHAAQGIALGPLAPATLEGGGRGALPGEIVLAPPSAFAAKWAQRFAAPLLCFASGWMQVRARARQRLSDLPLVISDHCDWPALTRTITETGAGEVWVTHGAEDALVHWCRTQGLEARPLRLVGYEDEAEEVGAGEAGGAEDPAANTGAAGAGRDEVPAANTGAEVAGTDEEVAANSGAADRGPDEDVAGRAGAGDDGPDGGIAEDDGPATAPGAPA